jgi:hypothetical protein
MWRQVIQGTSLVNHSTTKLTLLHSKIKPWLIVVLIKKSKLKGCAEFPVLIGTGVSHGSTWYLILALPLQKIKSCHEQSSN